MSIKKSLSRSLTKQEWDELYPPPIKCDLEKMKEKFIEENKQFRKNKYGESDEDAFKESVELLRTLALAKGVKFMERKHPDLSLEQQAGMLERFSHTRKLHKLYLEDLSEKQDIKNFYVTYNLILAEELREWSSEVWRKYGDVNCFIGAMSASNDIIHDIRVYKKSIEKMKKEHPEHDDYEPGLPVNTSNKQ